MGSYDTTDEGPDGSTPVSRREADGDGVDDGELGRDDPGARSAANGCSEAENDGDGTGEANGKCNGDDDGTGESGGSRTDELLSYGTDSRFVCCERTNPRAWICTDTVYALDEWR